MPKDNIERAIAKGAGVGAEADGIESVLYEGYGPGGVALLVEALTDNRNRTGADVATSSPRTAAASASRARSPTCSTRRATIVIDGSRYSEDDLMVAIEAGAEDISADEDVFEVVTEPADFARVRRRARGGRASRWRAPRWPTGPRASCRSRRRRPAS